MQPNLHEHTKAEWQEYHLDQELEQFMARARNSPRDPEPRVYDL